MKNKKSNKLIHEKSPYLLQHAYNPVDWHAWNNDAFEEARKNNKPIFLSIGYSTCHWCHVMEHESFEDEEVAKLMNETFVNIKVDREERPDIDGIYMSVCQELTGSGGWPLSIIMTADKKPFFAGTYFPKEKRHGRMGMLDLIPKVSELWKTKEAELINSAEQITQAIQHASKTSLDNELTAETLELAFKQFVERYDEQFGGFGNAPKFPSPHNLTFLLRYWNRTGDTNAKAIVEKTLFEMRQGGIYDQIGFGFHRYSTDKKWLLPHFEKMLYDQATLMIAYSELYQSSKNQEIKKTVSEIGEFVLRDLTSPQGAFYSALDADSDGEEGKFYFWKVDEIKKLLKNDAQLFIEIFNLKEEGNFFDPMNGGYTTENIFHLQETIEDYANRNNLSVSEVNEKINLGRKILFEEREKRVHPFKDDKVLTDWNGLMIGAFAIAAQSTNESKFIGAAKNSLSFIKKYLIKEDGKLLHRYRDGEAAIDATLEDYAFLIFGLIELYQTSFEQSDLALALNLNEIVIQHFWDAENGAFYFTSDDAEEMIIRQKEIYDGAIPSGNSMMMLNLIRLAHLTGRIDYKEKASVIRRAFYNNVKSSPSAYSQLMNGIIFLYSESVEIVVVGKKENADTIEILKTLHGLFLPNKVILLKEGNELDEIAPFTKEMKMEKGKTTIYVCKNYSCNLPVNTIDEMLHLIK
ncbi:MAG: thioredoxin domain-containing protein [Chlorobiaceae bacterium]|nr:thioredoxin domain-containing protein [Chlorobiaceae bacterium]